MVAAIHFHRELRAGREEVHDEPSPERNLPLERNSELFAAQLEPQKLLRRPRNSPGQKYIVCNSDESEPLPI